MDNNPYGNGLFDLESQELNDCINGVDYELRHNNSEVIEICRKIERLKNKFPKIREIFEEDDIFPLNYKESEALKQTIDLYRELIQQKYYGIFFRGGRECHNYYKKMGII